MNQESIVVNIFSVDIGFDYDSLLYFLILFSLETLHWYVCLDQTNGEATLLPREKPKTQESEQGAVKQGLPSLLHYTASFSFLTIDVPLMNPSSVIPTSFGYFS